MAVGRPHLQDTFDGRRSLQERAGFHEGGATETFTYRQTGDVIEVRKPPVTYSFKVKQTIEKRVGAKLIPEILENVTPPEQYELLEMSRLSGFIGRARGTGRPTKKDRRSLEEFTTPEYLDDLLFDFDVEDEEGGEDD